jgi:Fe2+ transport system protein FeoA
MQQFVNSSPSVPLSQLMAGEFALVESIAGSSELVCRLAELGLCNGTPLEMVRPGATCILRINGTKLCVRGDELLRVMVTPLPASARHSA